MAIKNGTSMADTLFGGGPDTLQGGAGDDTYVVYSQQDVVVETDQGLSFFDRDTVYTYSSYALGRETAVETLSTAIHAGTEPFFLVGNRFTRTIIGNYGDNIIDPGSNYFERGAAGVTLNGLQGDDIYRVYGGSPFSETIVEARGGGIDTVYASGNFTLNGGAEVERLIAADQASTTSPVMLTGNEFAQAIAGSFGNDQLQGLGGADTLIGLGGDDFYGADADDVIVEAAGEGYDTLSIRVTNGYVLPDGLSIEDLRVSFGSDAAPGYVIGNAFSQIIHGGGGANTLNGAGGADTLIGGAGDDVYRVYSTGDIVRESAGEGFDTIYASASYRLEETAEVEVLSTAAQAGSEAIALFGNGYAQTLVGNFGANVLDGGAGADTLIGLAGDDAYRVDSIRDQVIEAVGGGNDIVYASGTFALQAGSEVETLSTLSHAATEAINLTGNAFAQTVIGNSGVNRIDGGAGADTLIGLAGDDVFSFTSPLGSGNVDVLADYGNGDDVIALDPSIFTGLPNGDVAAGAIAVGTAAADADDRIVYNPQTGAISYDADGSGAGAAIQFASLPTGLAASALRLSVQGLLSATISAPRAAEGATSAFLDFVVTFDRPAPSGLVLDYATTDGTAISTGIPQRGQDFTAVSGQIAVAAGETSITIRVPVIGDNALEPDESLTLRVSGTGLAAPVTSTGVIVNDDSTAYINDGRSYSIGGATQGIALESAYPAATAFVIGASNPALDGLRHDIAFGPNSYGPNALPITFAGNGGPAVGTFDFAQLGKPLVVRPGQDFRTADGELIATIPLRDQQFWSEPDEIIGTPFADTIDRSDARTSATSPTFFGTSRGGAGNDTLIGGGAQDGGEGDDLLVGIFSTVMTGGAGADIFRLPALTPYPGTISWTAPNRVTDLNVAEDRIELVLNRASDLQPGALDPSRFHVGAAAATPDQRIIYDPATGELFFDANGSQGDPSGARTLFAQLPANLDLTAGVFTLVAP